METVHDADDFTRPGPAGPAAAAPHSAGAATIRARRWRDYEAIQPKSRHADETGVPVTATGGTVAALLRAGLPDIVVYRQAGAASLAAVRAYRTRLIDRGEDVPTAPEALRRWQDSRTRAF